MRFLYESYDDFCMASVSRERPVSLIPGRLPFDCLSFKVPSTPPHFALQVIVKLFGMNHR